jgi:AraC family transcriptional regulator of adaptative response / DNA-3-methyladenine glycosylase II
VLNSEVCYRALKTRDERFDGRIFVGVTSTGIYCRPICPARPAKFENCRFFPSAAAAQEAGFRPCLRCRPETAPDVGSWRGTSNTVSRGLVFIAEGELDGENASIDGLAERLGVGGRQLRRLFQQHLGASPIAVAQTRRVLLAKQLIHETDLEMADVALAAGFGSVRRFNEVFRSLYRRPPSELRRQLNGSPSTGTQNATGVTVRVRYRPPYDWAAMLSFLRAREVDGVECVDNERYVRTIVQDGEIGTVEVAHAPEVESITATIRFPSVRALSAIISRVRRVFDLGADIDAIDEHLARDPLLAPLLAERPGLRVPGAWDGFELAVRAILGQHVSVKAARRLAGRLAGSCGSEVKAADFTSFGLSRAFPSPSQLMAVDVGALKIPRARKRALLALAEAALDDPHLFRPQKTVEETVARLGKIAGIGDWTAHYVALRAGGEPDAFPATDAALLRGAAKIFGSTSSAELVQRAERWRPWRAYAAQHLWAAASAAPDIS